MQDDLISRQAVLDQTYLWSKDEFLRVTNPFDYLRKRINSLPPVTPKQKYGKWIAQQEVNGDDYFKAYDISGVMTYAAKYKCDKCGFIQICIEDHGQYNYCPHCGCRMVEPQESEKALDNEGMLEKIKNEIEDYVCNHETNTDKAQGMLNALQILDKYR